ncbi:MAG: serine/threonine protein kinase [Acidobacteriota bacterium]|nr:serine/threonine protein kinase [Acidobacteriota bacterium]
MSWRGFTWTRLLLLLAFVKVVGVLVARLLLPGPSSDVQNPYHIPQAFDLIEAAALSALAAFLLVTGRRDERAVSLGGFFLLVGNTFCGRPVGQLVLADNASLAGIGLVFGSLRPDIFIPFLLWRFVRDFPRTSTPLRLHRIFEHAIRVAWVGGCILFGANLLGPLLRAILGRPVAPRLFSITYPQLGGGLYFGFMLIWTALAIPFLIWKAHAAQGEERRRVGLFTAGLVLGVGPGICEVLLEILFAPHYLIYMTAHPALSLPVGIAVDLCLLTLPLSTGYSVFVYKVLDLKLVARRALQYALARYSALALATVPLLAILVYLYEHRAEPLGDIFSGSRMLLLLSGSALGMAALRYRGRLLDAIDRRFFREQYDARQILALLVERIRGTKEGTALARLVAREVDMALHLESIALLVVDPRNGMLCDPKDRARRLDATSPLASLIADGAEPLSTDLEDPRSPLVRLPEKDRHWLVDSGLRLIVPILARDGSLLGLIGLGEKKSGLPFLKEDRQLLRAIASSAAWVLEFEHSTAPGRLPRRASDADTPPTLDLESPVTEFAKECMNCGSVYQSYTVFCSNCSRRLETAHVPYVLPGKFRFDKRIGAGGMGVVYQGADLALGRPVAVKTMRRVSPEDAMRLRREARTAAAVSHPHLASVYGIETWQGTPMLILELLEGGTLNHRVEREKLTPVETIDLGIAMAEALERLHTANILHRDIKPSNIGYTRDGTPKLMDFGIARAMFDVRRDAGGISADGEDEEVSALPPTSAWDQTSSMTLSRQQLVGTLSYLSPEALDGQQANVTFDLWSLAIVLYECLLGSKVFGGGDVRQLMTRIRLGRVPDFAQVCPEYDEALGDFFRSALHRTPARRPANAREFKERLAAIKRQRFAAT